MRQRVGGPSEVGRRLLLRIASRARVTHGRREKTPQDAPLTASGKSFRACRMENKLWLARPDACCVKGAPEDQSGATAADRRRRRQFQSVMGVTVMRYNDGQRQRQTDAGGKAEKVLCT